MTRLDALVLASSALCVGTALVMDSCSPAQTREVKHVIAIVDDACIVIAGGLGQVELDAACTTAKAILAARRLPMPKDAGVVE